MKSLRVLLLFLLGSYCSQAQMNNNYFQYFGKYQVSDGPFSTIEIYESDGKFMGEAVGQGSSELKSTDTEHEFSLVDYPGGSLKFTQGTNKITNALILIVDGSEINATREFQDLEDYKGNFQRDSDLIANMEIKL